MRGLPAEILHLARGRGTCRVARQSATGIQELLGPAVIHRGGNAIAAAELRDVLLAAQPCDPANLTDREAEQRAISYQPPAAR